MSIESTRNVKATRGRTVTVASDHEKALSSLGVRTRQGSFYTPLDVAEQMVEKALLNLETGPSSVAKRVRVLDPTCGSGNFLIASAMVLVAKLEAMGMDRETAFIEVVRNSLFGCDFDAEAVDICINNLVALSFGRVSREEVASHIQVKDSLKLSLLGGGESGQISLFDDPEPSWSDVFPEVFSGIESGFDLVVGNPPFLSQLQEETVLDPSLSEALVARFGKSLSKLTNPASVFLLIASELISERGIVTMIQPASFLATRESAEIRSTLVRRMTLSDLWVGGSKIFDAAVEVVGISLTRLRNDVPTRISVGRDFESIQDARQPSMEDNTWSYLLARAKGVPECTYGSSGIVGEIASATADFRDQYYGLVGLVREAGSSVVRPTQMKLATVGLIDLGEFLWGLRSTRFAKTKYTQPVVEVSELPKRLGDWANSRKRPKIMVSNQTRIVEVFVDEVGDILPSVPILTVDCGADDLWRVAASLASPVASILATERHLGAGMSADVIKMSARDLLNLPLPTNSEKWSEGSELFQRIQAIQDASVRIELLAKFGHVMCDAFEAPSKVFDWWWSRIPKRTQES